GAPLDLPPRLPEPKGEVAVKEVVFPFVKFDGVDPVLGPEMRSTGEVMAWGKDLALAYWKAQAAAGSRLPDQGTVYLHAGPVRMGSLVPAGREVKQVGFDLVADAGTSADVERRGVATGIADEAPAAQASERGESQLLVGLPDPGQRRRPG